MTYIADLRLHRIREAAAASRRAGYRTTPPPDTEADKWVCSIQAGEDEDGQSIHRMIWHPRKEAMDWQHARFGPLDPPLEADPAGHGSASGHDGQEENVRAGDDLPT